MAQTKGALQLANRSLEIGIRGILVDTKRDDDGIIQKRSAFIKLAEIGQRIIRREHEMRYRYWQLALLLSCDLIAVGALCLGVSAHEITAGAGRTAQTVVAREPLYDNLGDLRHPISTENKLAQKYFDQGLRWTYAFNHAAARRAFQEAQRQDPDCAMCYWGEAFVLGPNINAPMQEAASNPAVIAIGKATETAQNANEREKALIHALALRYSADTGSDRATLDKAYADAMAKVYKRFPDDPDVAVLYADAVMNTSPWDYWEADGTTPKGRIGKAIAAIKGVLAENQEHPGAIHLYIHLTEASANPEVAEPYADRIADLMPGAGHLVHMGSHTFYRLGRFRDSIEVNKRAVEADEAYFTSAEDESLWKYGYRPHNIHYVVVSALMAGNARTALEYAKRLDGTVSDEAAEIGWIQVIRQAPYFAHAHLSDPDTILDLDDPGDKFPFVQAMWHYARGTAFARKGKLKPARIEAARIAHLAQRTDVSYPVDIEFVVQDVLAIARHVLEGRLAQAEGDPERAVREYEFAVRTQDSLAYMEPPFWYYPVRQSLGAALVQAGKPEAAEAVFKKSLARVPNNGWALFGLMKAQQARGDAAAARATRERFLQAWAGGDTLLRLDRL